MSKRKYGEYKTLKEARAAAREHAHYNAVAVYEEPDGSFSIGHAFHKKAKLICGIDKSGRRYQLVWTRDYFGKKIQKFEPIEKRNNDDSNNRI